MGSHPDAPSRHHPAAYSLIELLVVIAIITVLLALLTSIIVHVREQAQRVKCANNLRQAGVALQAYGNSNRGRLPEHPYLARDGHTFAYNVPRATADALVGYTGSYTTLFCPAGEAEYDP